MLQVELCAPAAPTPPRRHYHLRCTRCMVELSLTVAASKQPRGHTHTAALVGCASAGGYVASLFRRRSSTLGRRGVRQLQLLNIGARSQQLSTFALTKATTTNESVVQVQDSSTSYTTKVPYLPSGRTYFFSLQERKKSFIRFFGSTNRGRLEHLHYGA